ncbi:alpha/beta fold hydrolase [Pseudomonas abyssi]|uniref:Uncharacterized protein n=1 Tax=Pseudomonas abyssi TaxID=170540 RepID=A0A395R723_9PSED|nr:alpha/beta fold hydrolase [Halopseudomonas gallaeciensis]RGP55883.1 hypothetical protein ASB58_00355 [Halopseudomonas gallaeciensis]
MFPLFKQQHIRVATWALIPLALSGCLSGSGSSGSDQEVGRFIDGPVSGLEYRSASGNGKTNSDGEFRYKPGERVYFSLAGMPLGSAPGQALIGPQDIIDAAEDSSHPAVINVARLLQTLDADENLNNGIELSPAVSDALSDFQQQNPSFELALDDDAAFQAAMQALLDYLNAAETFGATPRQPRPRLAAWLHLRDYMEQSQGSDIDFSLRPVIFVHGGAGSASQFESQAQRFIANGYPRSHLATYEYDTNPPDFTRTTQELDAAIDSLRASTGFDQVNLMGHSMGTEVSRIYLADPARAAKIAAYVNFDGRGGDEPPGGVPNLVMWGQYVTQEVTGATNVYPDPEDPIGHIEVATAASSFARVYAFFNGQAPATTSISEAAGEDVWIAGRANLFPANSGAVGTILEITEVDPSSGRELSSQPRYSQAIDSDGQWGPVRLSKGASYSFLLHRPGTPNADHYFYREPYDQDSFQVRLNTSEPGKGVGALLSRSPRHSNLSISRDMELWGDQGDRNDQLTVNGTLVVTAQTAPLLNRLSNIFLHDRNADGISKLDTPDPVLHAIPFMSGLDLYLPAASEPNGVISISLNSRRGDGTVRTINVPNWPSDQIRSISVHFRDHSD